MGRINIEIEELNHRKLKSICALKDITLTEYLNQILKEKIKKLEK